MSIFSAEYFNSSSSSSNNTNTNTAIHYALNCMWSCNDSKQNGTKLLIIKTELIQSVYHRTREREKQEELTKFTMLAMILMLLFCCCCYYGTMSGIFWLGMSVCSFMYMCMCVCMSVTWNRMLNFRGYKIFRSIYSNKYCRIHNILMETAAQYYFYAI